jgi:hypothetical protein
MSRTTSAGSRADSGPHKKGRDPLPSPACVYCGNAATTRDHVPPRAIFVELQLPNLVTVPACEDCNNRASQSDEGFRNIVGMRAPEESPNSLTVWEKTFRSLKRNRSELEALWESLRQVPVFTSDGSYLGIATEAAFDADAHDRTIERITRGLYFHHFGEPLPFDSPVEAYPIRDGADWQKAVAPLLLRMRIGNIGGPATFEYAFARDEDDPNSSLWIYRFYARHFAAAETGVLVKD